MTRIETTVTEHPSDVELQSYARGALAAADLLRIDDHLAVCSVCRTQAFTSTDAARRLSAAAAAVRRDLAPPAAVPVRSRPVATPDRSRWVLYAAVAASAIVGIVLGGRGGPLRRPRLSGAPSPV